MLSVKSDFLLLELDESRDLHTTLVFSKGIKKRMDLVEALKIVIRNLNLHPETIAQYSSLPYFGQDEIEYWHDTPNSYPLNVKKPNNYVPKPKIIETYANLSPAGSLI